MAGWAREAHKVSERRAARILVMALSAMRYRSRRPLHGRLRQLAATYVRYGYRRLTVLLRREGWAINAKRVYRLYDVEQLKVRSVERKKIGLRTADGASAGQRP